MDMTWEKIIVPSITNLVIRHEQSGLKDIGELKGFEQFKRFGYKRGSRIWITGAGATLDDWIDENIWMENDFVIANQSTAVALKKAGIRIDLIVLADPQPVVAAWLEMFENKYGSDIPVFASLATGIPPGYKHWFWKPFLRGDSREVKIYNELVGVCAPMMKTFILQAGNVVNAATLAILEIFKGDLKPDLFYAGVDSEFIGNLRASVRCSNDQLKFVTVADTDVLLFGGRRTSEPLLNYRKDLETIVRNFECDAEFSVYVPEYRIRQGFQHLLADFMMVNNGITI